MVAVEAADGTDTFLGSGVATGATAIGAASLERRCFFKRPEGVCLSSVAIMQGVSTAWVEGFSLNKNKKETPCGLLERLYCQIVTKQGRFVTNP